MGAFFDHECRESSEGWRTRFGRERYADADNSYDARCGDSWGAEFAARSTPSIQLYWFTLRSRQFAKVEC